VDLKQIESLRAEARYARERYDLYQAKTYGSRPTTATRLNELRRISQGATERLQKAEAELAAQSSD
jgi:hypothetical protein